MAAESLPRDVEVTGISEKTTNTERLRITEKEREN